MRDKVLEFKIWTPGFCFHFGPWAIVQGRRVLDPESDDLVESSSSHTYQLGGPGQSHFLWQRRLYFYVKPFSVLPKYTIGLYRAPCNCFGHVAES